MQYKYGILAAKWPIGFKPTFSSTLVRRALHSVVFSIKNVILFKNYMTLRETMFLSSASSSSQLKVQWASVIT